MRAARAPAFLVLPACAAAVASFAVIGADARWLCRLGEIILDGHLPSSLPFATAPTSGWHDAPALGEIVFHLLGDGRGLVVAQVLAAAVGLAALGYGLRDGDALLPGLLVVVGSLPAFLITRNALFSLALFPLLLLLLERGDRLWLAVPLLLLWANLYGGVLVGWALLAVYVVVARRRAWPVLVAGTLAIFATPALWHTPQYYWNVSRNEAARQGVGLWAHLGTNVFDVVLVLAALVLVWRGRRSWRPWEAVAALGLVAATINTARLGIWLLLVLAYPAARGRAARQPVHVLVPAALAAVVVVGLLAFPRADAGELARTAASSGEPVLADAIAAEQVEALGGRVWVANPLDAFRAEDQRLYLDWLRGRGPAAVERAALVLVRRQSDAGRAAATDERLRVLGRNDRYALYRVVR